MKYKRLIMQIFSNNVSNLIDTLNGYYKYEIFNVLCIIIQGEIKFFNKTYSDLLMFLPKKIQTRLKIKDVIDNIKASNSGKALMLMIKNKLNKNECCLNCLRYKIKDIFKYSINGICELKSHDGEVYKFGSDYCEAFDSVI